MRNISKPLVTVIVPAYNHELWVKDAILSIVNQTYGYKYIQLIVTDDCSKDKTPMILKDLASKYNFQLIGHRENQGITSTLNEMINLSKGKYIAGIASDDIMCLDRLEKQISILEENPQIDILAGSCFLIDKDGKVIHSPLTKNDNSLISYDFNDLFLGLKPGFPAGSATIRRDLYQRIGSYDPNYKIEDYYFWLKATYNKANIQVSKIPVFYYRLHNSSISSQSELMDEERKKILNIYKSHPLYYKAVKNIEIRDLLKIALESKTKAIKHIISNPTMVFNRKTLKTILLIMLPKLFTKNKFIEMRFRNDHNSR
jgi:alpha-1,3-rhamnosyltransferase